MLKRWNIVSVGVGDLLRQEILRGSQRGKEAEAVMKSGGLLPDQTVLSLVRPEILQLKQDNWILDGFPRKLSQAILLDELLASVGEGLNLVVSLKVPDEVILSRIEGTRNCLFSLTFSHHNLTRRNLLRSSLGTSTFSSNL